MTNDKWLFANLYKPRFVTCSLKPEACPGFTLVELLVIVVILGFLLSMMPRVFTEDSNQRRFDETRERMKEIKKAILGIPGSYLVEGSQRFGGYVVDMGRLPVLNRDRQPEELWEQKGQAGKSYSSRCRRPIGWGGPYMEKPRGGILKDGWGNPLVFKDSFTCLLEIARGNMVIVSYGSDGMPGGSGYGEDITLEIRRPQYMAQVAGQAAEDITDVKIWFNSEGNVMERKITGLSPCEVFRFESRGQGEPEEPLPGRDYCDIPVGQAVIVSSSFKLIYFHVEPAVNWLGVVH